MERSRFQSKQEQKLEQVQKVNEFATAEELLRHEGGQVPVPEGLDDRVRASLAEATPERKPWWRKLF